MVKINIWVKNVCFWFRRQIFLKFPGHSGRLAAAARGFVPLSHGVAAATALRSTACHRRRAAARVRAMTGFSFNKAVFKPFMYKFSDHLSGKSAQLPSVAVQCPVAGIHSSSDNIIDYRWWVGGRQGGWNLVCQKQKRISLTTHRSVPNTHWGQRLLRVFILNQCNFTRFFD